MKIFKFTLFALFASVFLTNCKKQEQNSNISLENVNVSKFFENTENMTGPISRIVSAMKNKQQIDPSFIPNIIKNYGYAKWDKYVTSFEGSYSNRTTSSEDSVIYIPVVQNTDSTVNTSLQATLSNQINISLRQSVEYSNYTFSTNAGTVGLADEYALIYFNLTKNVYGKKHFKVTDQRLFKNIVSNTIGNYTRVVSIGNDSTQNNLLRSAPLDCGTVSEFTVTDNCPHTGICAVTCDACYDCIQVHNNWANFCNQNSGGGGVSTPAGPYTGPGAAPTGWTPLTPLELLTLRLNTALQAPRESYIFDNNLDPSNSYIWNTDVNSFVYYMRNTLLAQITNNTTYQAPETINVNPQDDTKTVRQKVQYSVIWPHYGVKLDVKLKKDPNTLKWNVESAVTDNYGFWFSSSWQDKGIFITTYIGDFVEVVVYGNVCYNVFFEGVGTVYKSEKKYKLKINRNSGEIVAASEV